MKPDADPGRTREFEVLAILILLALATASMSDFLLAPSWTPLVVASQPADDSDLLGILIEPWVPQVPDKGSSPGPTRGNLEVASSAIARSVERDTGVHQ